MWTSWPTKSEPVSPTPTKPNHHVLILLSSGGAGFLTLLTLVFIVLKLTGYIDWSWWWVLSPLIGGIVLVLIFAVFVGVLFKKYG